MSRHHAKHLPPAQHGTEVQDDHGCHPASAFPSVVGGLCFLILGTIFLGSTIVALWRWLAGVLQ